MKHIPLVVLHLCRFARKPHLSGTANIQHCQYSTVPMTCTCEATIPLNRTPNSG